MKYTYSKDTYHPKDVSFEVSALLMNEEKEGYTRQIERSFNPLTDQNHTEKYIEHAHEFGHASEIINAHELQNKQKQPNNWKQRARRSFHVVKESFEAVIQKVLVEELVEKNLEEAKSTRYEDKILAEEKEQEKFIHAKAMYHAEEITNQHVNALKHEQAQVRFL
jgi:hypothetical protein